MSFISRDTRLRDMKVTVVFVGGVPAVNGTIVSLTDDQIYLALHENTRIESQPEHDLVINAANVAYVRIDRNDRFKGTRRGEDSWA